MHGNKLRTMKFGNADTLSRFLIEMDEELLAELVRADFAGVYELTDEESRKIHNVLVDKEELSLLHPFLDSHIEWMEREHGVVIDNRIDMGAYIWQNG